MNKQQEIVASYKIKGFRFEKEWLGEYILLIDPKTLQKVRVYEDGSVWISDLKSGEYQFADGISD